MLKIIINNIIGHIMGVACLEFRGENFRGWRKNCEIRESFLSRKFPTIQYTTYSCCPNRAKQEVMSSTIQSFNCRYGRSVGTIWLTNLGCTSSDLMLSTCSNSGFGNTFSCSHSDDVAVTCNDSSTGE